MKGVSTRSVDDLVAALRVSAGISRSEVSPSAVSSTRRSRPSAPVASTTPFPYMYLDSTYLHVRVRPPCGSKAVVIATRVREDGHREVLSVDVGNSENELFGASPPR